MNRRLAFSLVLIFAISLIAPLAMALLGCKHVNQAVLDDWDKVDDGTENQPDWIEGVYEFDLIDTSTIEMK